MLSFEEIRNNPEISKLIQFGYDLHKDELGFEQCYKVPMLEFYDSSYCPMKKIDDNRYVFGLRGYITHTDSEVYTKLGVIEGTWEDAKFKVENAIFFDTSDSEDSWVLINFLEVEDDYRFYDFLQRSSVRWDEEDDNKKVALFLSAMEIIGFNKDDTYSLLKGEMTAEDIYLKAAPEKLKYIRWVNIDRRFYIFNKNVVVEGDFSGVWLKDFPFPFEGDVIIDCEKTKISYAHFEECARKFKLVNLKKNLKYLDLRDVVIDEVIDLSKVDATGTIFGSHKVINSDNSLGRISKIDLSLAVFENGEGYATDGCGLLSNDKGQKLVLDELKVSYPPPLVLASADNAAAIKKAFQKTADGIGLVRTEYIFSDINIVTRMINMIINRKQDNLLLDDFKTFQENHIRNMLDTVGDKRIVFRILDFKLEEFLKIAFIGKEFNYSCAYEMRGARLLNYFPSILKAQLNGIFSAFDGTGKEMELLVPMIVNIFEFKNIKKIIKEISSEYNIGDIRIGAMIEDTLAIKIASELAREADFICFGTNDLTSCITGIQRGEESLCFQVLDSDVKEDIVCAIEDIRTVKEDMMIGFCGDHCDYVENLQFYCDVGASYVTCSPAYIKSTKQMFNNIDLENKKEQISNLTYVLKKVIKNKEDV